MVSSIHLQLWATPFAPNEVKIDDFKDLGRNGESPDRMNLWGGHWEMKLSNSDMGVTYTGPGEAVGQLSAGMTGVYRAPGYALFQTPLFESWDTSYNAACHGLNGIQFWMKGDGKPYRVNVPNKADTEGAQTGNWYGLEISPPSGVWTLCKIPFNALTLQNGWNPQSKLPEHSNGSDVTGIQFFPLRTGPFSFSLSQISFYGSYIPICSTPNIGMPNPILATVPTPKPTSTLTPMPLMVKVDPSPLVLGGPVPKGRQTPTPAYGAENISLKKVSSRLAKVLLKEIPTPDQGNKIEFTTPPANIFVTFADGPGRYQVEVVDSFGNSLEAIFDRKIAAENEKWLEWDGLDSQGKDVPPGQYYVIIYKDGRALKSFSVIRTPAGH